MESIVGCIIQRMPMGKRILVVEDDPDYRMLLRARLQSYGFNVIEAEDGISGVELVRSQNPDLILLDVMLPGMNGFASDIYSGIKFCSKNLRFNHLCIL